MNSYAESKSVISCLAFPSSGCLLLTLHPLRVDAVFSAFSFLFIYLLDSLYLVFTHRFYLPVCSCMGFTTHVCLISASCFLSLHFSPLPWLSLWTLWVSELFGTTRGRASDDHRTICSSASSYIIPLMYQLFFFACFGLYLEVTRCVGEFLLFLLNRRNKTLDANLKRHLVPSSTCQHPRGRPESTQEVHNNILEGF